MISAHASNTASGLLEATLPVRPRAKITRLLAERTPAMRAHTPFFRILLVLAALAAVPRWAMTQETTGAAEGRDDAVLRQTARGPAADRVDAAALERLLDEAARTHSDALAVLLDGELVGAWYSAAGPRRIESMSVTKSIVNLAVGRLVTLGRIPSVDVPVSAFYPEWNTGRKAKVTLRHLMNHTSGIAAKQSTAEIYASDDFVRLALDAEITSEPGTVFFYNNKAVNLIAGIVEKSAGKRMDLFLRDDLFAHLGIADFGWSLDRAGNPQAMAGLQIRAEDLARLGQLVLQRGEWNGEQLIDEAWFDESLRPSAPNPGAGLLWWLMPSDIAVVIDDSSLARLRDAGVDPTFVARAEGARGRYASGKELGQALAEAFGEDWRTAVRTALEPHGLSLHRIEIGEILGINANGYLGQYLVIYPAKKLVAVRMIEATKDFDQATDDFQSFMELVYALVP